MSDLINDFYFIVILIPLLGLIAQWFAWRFHLPAIVLLSATGLLLGPTFHLIQPDLHSNEALKAFVKFSVAIILFEGGLYLQLFELKEVFSGVKRLVFPTIPIAWGIYALCTHYIGGISWPIAFIFGAIIVVSGPTVVIPLLRQARLKRKTASYIKWEGIINDPIGALLAVLVFQYFLAKQLGDAEFHIFYELFKGLSVALLLGIGAGYILAYTFKKGLVPEFLKPTLSLVLVLFIYYVSNLALEEAGLLAATAFGITLSNLKLPSIGEIRRFNESLGIILISCLFIILTATLNISQISNLNISILLLILAIMFIARPIIILLSTIGSDVSWPDRILLSWIAPRGVVAAAVAGVFAYELTEAGLPDAQILVPLVFALILTTVVAHGFSLSFVAKKLGLAATKNNGVLIVGASLWSIELAKALHAEDIPVLIAETSWHKLKFARLAGLRVYFGQVLSEEAEERLDLSEMGYVIAVSDNDAFNALVCSRFGHELGRHNVFQLPVVSHHEKDARDLPSTLAGKQLFTPEYTYESLLRDHFLDWTFQCTTFSDAFTFEQFNENAKTVYLPILIIHTDTSLSFYSADMKVQPKSGEKLLTFTQKINGTKNGNGNKNGNGS
tara:strand:- start:13992 stop:15836 length:1845 start_codon:yes stop_codon:yes gene_type:complete